MNYIFQQKAKNISENNESTAPIYRLRWGNYTTVIMFSIVLLVGTFILYLLKISTTIAIYGDGFCRSVSRNPKEAPY